MVTAQESIRLDSWRGVLEKTNRILSEEPVTVTIVSPENLPAGMEEVPGWSDGVAIHFNGAMLRKAISATDPLTAVLRMKGLNYHELCHVLYTPRMNDDLVRRVIQKQKDSGDRTWWYAFNALEDQRIETWFTSTFGPSRRYFEATVLEWIIKQGNAEAAILVYGRKYLTPSMRVQAGFVFEKKYGKALYDEFKSCIDEYITLVLPTDTMRASQMITKFHDLLAQMKNASGANPPPLVVNDNGMPGHHDGNTNDPSVPRKGRILVKAARRARDKAQDAIDDAIDADIEEEKQKRAERQQQKQNSQDADKDDAGQSDQDGGEGGEDSADAAGAAGESDQPTGGSSDDDGVDGTVTVEDGGTGAGNDSVDDHFGDADTTLEDEIREMLDEAHRDLDDVHEDEQVLSDVDDVLDAIKATEHNGRLDAEGAAARATKMQPNDDATLAVRRVRTILTRIRQEAEPETLRRQYHGRVDPRRIAQRKPHEVDVFRSWDPGSEEETGVEAVLLLDVSGSMSGMMKEASTAVWVLKRAFDKLDIRTTVLVYDTRHTVLYQPSDKAGPQIPVTSDGGGTDPTSALQQAQRILTKSQAPNKVLITVTDGQWGASDNVIGALMKQMHKIGVTSLLLGLGNAYGHYGKHHHLEGHDMATVRDLPKAVLKLVAGIMRNATL